MRYNPFTYNPIESDFFMGGNTGLPDTAAALAADHPDLAQHINSVWAFLSWMQNTSPGLYQAITNTKPALVDPATVVASGSLAPKNSKAGLKGLADAGVPNTDMSYTGDGSSASASASPATDWGTSLLNTIQSIAPAYFQVKSQEQLMNINIQRAEQGLPPIDSSALAPTVNVGVSPAVQMIGYLAVGGLVLVGLMTEFGKNKRHAK